MTSRSRGGEGGCPKHDVVREVAWIYSYDQPKMRDKGGRGVQKPENLHDVIYGWSLAGKAKMLTQTCFTFQLAFSETICLIRRTIRRKGP